MIIDTHVLLWYYAGDTRLSKTALRVLRKQDCLISIASLWEIALKYEAGKLSLEAFSNAHDYGLAMIQKLRLTVLPLEIEDAMPSEPLPKHHKDPFDRLIIQQAKRRSLPIVSGDKIFDSYNIKRIWR